MRCKDLCGVVGLGARSIVAGLLMLACGESGPCPGVSKGTEIEVELQALDEGSQSQAHCYEAWGFTAGASFTATVVKMSGEHSCKSGIAEVDGLGEWTWELELGAAAPGGDVLYGVYTIDHDGCSARLTLHLVSDRGADCDASSGDDCRLQVLAGPLPSSDDKCPALCGFIMAVRARTL